MGFLSKEKKPAYQGTTFEARYIAPGTMQVVRKNFAVGTTIGEVRVNLQQDTNGPHPKCLAFGRQAKILANEYRPVAGENIDILRPKTLRSEFSEAQFQVVYISYLMTVEGLSMEKSTELVPKLWDDCDTLVLTSLEDLKGWLSTRR